MSTRSRTLTVGGVLLAVLVAGLLVGFLALGNDDRSSGTTTTPSGHDKRYADRSARPG